MSYRASFLARSDLTSGEREFMPELLAALRNEQRNSS